MDNQGQFDLIDFISVVSFVVGLLNLIENREQSAHNDVQAANNQQARYLLGELTKQFEKQNEMLQKILEVTTSDSE
jgi:hypothetical protein